MLTIALRLLVYLVVSAGLAYLYFVNVLPLAVGLCVMFVITFVLPALIWWLNSL